MPKNLVTTLLAVTLLLLSTACSPEEGYKRPKIWPKPTDPEPASPVYHELKERMPSEEEIARDAAEHNARLEEAIESTLKDGDLVERETVFVHVLPELLQVEPQRLVALHARLAPGEPRDTLRIEMARLWASTDPPAAMRWMKSLDENERRTAATAAVTTLAPWDPRTASALAGEFGLEREDGIRKLLRSMGPPADVSPLN
jgi:hypothetical protein